MKFYFFILSMLLSFTLFGNTLKPCQIVGFGKVVEYAVTDGADTLSIPEKKEKIKQLKKCINKYAVCIVETNPRGSKWLSKKLVEPNNKNFDPGNRELYFGLIQYFDKEKDVYVCTAATNSFAQAVPWFGKTWTINGKKITGYELYGDRFTTVMTPKNLYKALLLSIDDELKSIKYQKEHEIHYTAKRDIELEKNVDIAERMLKDDSDPTFVSKITGISLESLKLLKK